MSKPANPPPPPDEYLNRAELMEIAFLVLAELERMKKEDPDSVPGQEQLYAKVIRFGRQAPPL